MKNKFDVAILGAGLAGCEAALQLAGKGSSVALIDAKPGKINDSVYKMDEPAELVCSNSLKSESPSTASYMLKEEMRLWGCELLNIAEKTKVPAGASLAVDRELFAKEVLKNIRDKSGISFIEGSLVSTIDDLKKLAGADYYIIATGPLTPEEMMNSISKDNSYFYDAIAPLVSIESLDISKMFWGSRYDKGEADFLNVPLTKQEYYDFVEALLASDKLPYNEHEKPKFFERCMPIEEMASRGKETLAFGPFRPVGFVSDGKRPYALLQLRTENKEKTAFNLVGCQTRMRQGAQKQVFSMLPGFDKADFLRYGSVHRNSFINAPLVLTEDWSLAGHPDVYIAGQLSGVEGYVESIFSGMFTAFVISTVISKGKLHIPPATTMSGSILRKLREVRADFQPVNANFSITEAAPAKPQKRLGKKEKKEIAVSHGLNDFFLFVKQYCPPKRKVPPLGGET